MLKWSVKLESNHVWSWNPTTKTTTPGDSRPTNMYVFHKCWNVWRCDELYAACEELRAVCEELCAVYEELCAVCEELCEMCERLCEVWERLREVCEGLLGSWKDVQMNVCIFYKSNSLFLSKFRSKPARTTTVVVIGYRGSRGYPYIWTWGMVPTPSSIVIRSH